MTMPTANPNTCEAACSRVIAAARRLMERYPPYRDDPDEGDREAWGDLNAECDAAEKWMNANPSVVSPAEPAKEQS